jgi:hypothetical protein
MWVPTADCDGHTAEARVQWLVSERGMSVEAARKTVLNEFPDNRHAPEALHEALPVAPTPVPLTLPATSELVPLTLPATDERHLLSLSAELLWQHFTSSADWLIQPADTERPQTLADAGWNFTYNGGGGGNQELQVYSDKCCFPHVGGGVYLQATVVQGRLLDQGFNLAALGGLNVFSPYDCLAEAGGNTSVGFEVGGRVPRPFDSSRINSQPLGYGVTSVRYRLPRGDFLWPALWMLPSRPSSWLNGGEIDLMESMGNQRGAGFAFFNDSHAGQRDGAALHLGAHAHGHDLNFFRLLWTQTMADARLVPSRTAAYIPIASSAVLEADGGSTYHTHTLVRTDDNLMVMVHDGCTAARGKTPIVRLDVDGISMHGSHSDRRSSRCRCCSWSTPSHCAHRWHAHD